MDFIFFALWILPHVCIAVILGLFMRRGQRRYLPRFFAYLVFELIDFGLGMAVYVLWVLFYPHQVSYLYYFTLIFGAGISRLLELAVIYEIAAKLVFASPYLTKSLHELLRWAAALSLLSASALSASLSRPGALIMNVIHTLEFSTNLIAGALLLILLLFTRALKVPWKRLPAGIALGFGVFAPLDMTASALYSALGRPGYFTVDMIHMAGFQICTAIWLVYVLPAGELRTTSRAPQLVELEQLDKQAQTTL